MAVSAEAPPEPVERALTLLFGSALPAAGEIGWLLEGYGLHVAGVTDPEPSLRDRPVPAWTDDDPTIPAEVWTAMQVSFVRHLIEHRTEEELRRFLSTARPGALDAAAREVFGVGLHDLDAGWRAELEGATTTVGFGQFARLAWRYMRPHRRREAEMLVRTFFGMAFALVFPFAMRSLLDDALPSGRFAAAMGTLGILAGALVVTIAAGLRRAQLSAYVSGAVVRDLRNGIFQRLQHLGARWYHDHNEGDVLARLLSDVQIVEQGLSQTLREGLVHVVGFTVGAIVLVLLHPVLAAVVLLAAPLLAVVYRLMSNGAQRRSRAAQEQLGGVVGIATENHAAQPVVKAFGLEGREQARFARAGERLFTATRRLQLWGGLFGLSINLVTAMLRIAVLAIGSWMVVHDHLTIASSRSSGSWARCSTR